MTPTQIARLRTLSHYRGWLAVATYNEFCELREMSKKRIDQDCEEEVIMIPREPKSRGK